jgi:hypothetical protein
VPPFIDSFQRHGETGFSLCNLLSIAFNDMVEQAEAFAAFYQ